MKNLILVFLIFFSMIGCSNNEKEYLEIIKQNNLLLQDEINIYNARLYMKSYEQPNRYDSITCRKINRLYNETNSIENYSDYKLINSKIKKIAIDEKLNIKFESITNAEKNILKNNLFLNLLYLNKMFCHKKSFVISDITFVPYIKDEPKSDTLILNFFNHNRYVITTDSIIDGKDKIINFKSYNMCNIWQIKYKPKSKKSTYYGKIFEVDGEGNTHLWSHIKHKITK